MSDGACTNSHTCLNGGACERAYTVDTAGLIIERRKLLNKGRKTGVPDLVEIYQGVPDCWEFKGY